MKTAIWLCTVGAGLALASACSSGNGFPPNWSQSPAEVSDSRGADSGLESLLVRLSTLDGRSRAELAEDLRKAEAEFALRAGPENRLELAWLLARPGSGFQDDRRAAGLLREYYEGPDAEGGYAAFARLFHDLLLARAVQQATAAKAKAQFDAEHEQASALREQVATLQQVLETLQKQFEALKDIETSLSARPSPETELLSNDGDTQDPTGR